MPKGQYVRTFRSNWKNSRGPYSEVFWSRVDKEGPIHQALGTRCWLWTGNRNRGKGWPNTYGVFRYSGAHRVSYTLCLGSIPEGLQVLHRCDNPPCVNPDHLFLGTQQDNMDDKMAKGRQGDSGTKTPPHGDLNGRAKLTRKLVQFSRKKYKEGWTLQQIADQIKCPVHIRTLYSALKGRTWRNV